MTAASSNCEALIVGAGPYGLAAAAHLGAAKIETRIVGEPMESWARHMPRGMFLRSSPECSDIGDPGRDLTLACYYRDRGRLPPRPVPVADFIDYGLWFQARATPDLDRRRVAEIDAEGAGFVVRLEDGEQLKPRTVIIATGITKFAWRPPEFGGLPPELASHPAELEEFTRFRGQRVVVVGGGQSALESAALLHEAGAEVEVLVRAPHLKFLAGRPATAPGLADLAGIVRHALRPLVRPNLDIMGPRVISWLVAWPRVFRVAPPSLRRWLTARAVTPAGAAWLEDRLEPVPIRLGRSIVAATPAGRRLDLRYDDGTRASADHLLLATGYRVDLRRHPLLSTRLKQRIRVRDGYPRLRPGFESSVPGLYFLGTAAAQTFGPMCRFVVGSRYAARALTAHIAGHTRARARRG